MAEYSSQQEKQHLTTAQLSALLDGQLPIEEREFSDAHLTTCEQCRQELEGLRQTVTLLHALPRPAPPRSFMLPLSTQQTAPVTPLQSTASSTSSPLRIVPSPATSVSSQSKRRARWSAYGRTALRTVGTLAAMIGFVLLISSLIPFINTNRVGSAGGASNAASGTSNSGSKPRTTQATPGSVPSAQPHFQGTTGQSTSHPGQQSSQNPTTGPSLPPVFDISTIGGRAFFGLLFLILGVIAMIAVRREPQRGP